MKVNKIWGWDDGIVGVFSTLRNSLTEETRPEWLSSADDATALDMEYHMNHSGNKIASPMLDDLADEHNDGKMSSIDRTNTVKLLWLKFRKKWERLWELYNIEYNPIENYSLTETDEPDITRTHSGTIEHKVSDDFKVNSKVVTESDVTVSTYNEDEGYTYGFNNSSPVPTDTSNQDNTSRTVADPEHNIVEGENTQTGATIDDHDLTDTETGKRTLTRSGNIGVMTYKMMVEGEVALWQWNFFDTVMSDVDSIIALSIYDYNKYERR